MDITDPIEAKEALQDLALRWYVAAHEADKERERNRELLAELDKLRHENAELRKQVPAIHHQTPLMPAATSMSSGSAGAAVAVRPHDGTWRGDNGAHAAP